VRITGRGNGDDRLTDGHRELVECCAELVAVRNFDGEFVVAAADVLHERVPGCNNPRGPVTLQAAHRPQPGFQSAMISLDRVIRVPLDGMQR
jgi:hypothetical protein